MVQLSALECSLGSAEGNTLRLRCRGVEPRHARLTRTAEGCRVEAFGPVYLNGLQIQANSLRRGDLLSIGPIEFEVLDLGCVERRAPAIQPTQIPQTAQPFAISRPPIAASLPPPPAPKPVETQKTPSAEVPPSGANVSNSVQQRLNQLESLLAVESERSGAFHREREAAAQEVNELQRALSQERAVSSSLVRERDQLRENFNQQQLELARLAAQSQQALSLHASAQQAAEQLVARQQQFQSEREQMTALVAQLESQLAARDQAEAMLVSDYQYREEAATARVSQLTQQLAGLDSELLAAKQLLQDAGNDQEQAARERERLISERDALKHEQDSLLARNHELAAAWEQQQTQSAEASSRQEQLQAEIANLSEQLTSLTASVHAADARSAALEAERQLLQEATQSLQQSLDEAQAALQNSRTQADAEIADREAQFQAEIAQLTEQLTSLTASVHTADARAAALEDERQLFQESTQSLQQALDEVQAALQNSRTQADAEIADREAQFQAEIAQLTEQLTSLTASVHAADARSAALEAERQLLQESTQSLQQALDEAQAELQHSRAQAEAQIASRQTAYEQKVAELEAANSALQTRLYEETQRAQTQGEEAVEREIELTAQTHQFQRAYADLQLEFRLSREREAAAQADLQQQLSDANHIIAARSLDLEQQQQAASGLARELAQARAELATQQAELARQAECALELQNQRREEQRQAEERLVSLQSAHEQTLAELASSRAENELRLQELTASLERERSEHNARAEELAAELLQARQAKSDAENHSQFTAERLGDEIHRLAGELLTTKQGLQTREAALEQLRGEYPRKIDHLQQQLSATQEDLHRLQQLRQKESEGWNNARRGLEAESNKLAQDLAERERQWNAIRFTIDNTNLEQQCELERLQGELAELKARIKSDRNDFSRVRSRLEAESAELADRLFQKSMQLQSLQGVSSASAENHRREAEALQSELATLRQQFDAELVRWTQDRSAQQSEWSKLLGSAQQQSRELETAHRAATTEVARLTGAVELLRSEATVAAELLRDDENRRLAERAEWEARLQKVAAELCDKQLEIEQLRGDLTVRQHHWSSETERLQREVASHKAQADDQELLLTDLRRQLAEAPLVKDRVVTEFAAERDLLAARVQSLASELERTQAGFAELLQTGEKQRIAWSQEKQTQESQTADLQALCAKREQELAELSDQLRAVGTRQAESAAEQEARDAEARRLRDEWEAVREQLESQRGALTAERDDLAEQARLREAEIASLREEAAAERESFSRQLAELRATSSAAEAEQSILREELARLNAVSEEARARPPEPEPAAEPSAASPEPQALAEERLDALQSSFQEQAVQQEEQSLAPVEPPAPAEDWSAAPPSQTYRLPQGDLAATNDSQGSRANLFGNYAAPPAPAQTENDEGTDPEFEARLARLLGRTVGKASESPKSVHTPEELAVAQPVASEANDFTESESDSVPVQTPPSEARSSDTGAVATILDRLKQSGVWKEPAATDEEEAAPPTCSATLNLQSGQTPFASEPAALEAPEPEASAEKTPSAAAVAPPPSHSPQPQEDADDEESIDDYMSRLLNRMRGGAAAPAQPTKEKPKPAQLSTQPLALPPEPQAPQVPPEPTEFVPRAAAPEKVDSLKAMREVANSAARGAIAVHSRERTKMTLAGRMVAGTLTLIIAVVAVGVGVYSRSLPALVGGLIGLLLGGSWLLTSCLEGIRSARLQPPRHD